MEKPNISSGTIIRTVILGLALVNQVLIYLGICPLPFEEDTLQELLSLVFTIAAAIWAWWKDNDFTQKARANKDAIKRLNTE